MQKKILLARFEKERQQDQNKIMNLTEEYRILKSKFQSGELQSLAETRQNSGKNSSRRDDERMKLNRFAGLEQRDQLVLLFLICIHPIASFFPFNSAFSCRHIQQI